MAPTVDWYGDYRYVVTSFSWATNKVGLRALLLFKVHRFGYSVFPAARFVVYVDDVLVGLDLIRFLKFLWFVKNCNVFNLCACIFDFDL